MAQSSAQKRRKRMLREGQFDFTQKRGGQAVQISTLTQCTKSKTQAIRATENKHKNRLLD